MYPISPFSCSVDTHVVGAVVSLLPLHQDDLSNHQRGDEDQDHLSVHGLMTTVLHVQVLVLHPATNKDKKKRNLMTKKKKTQQRERHAALSHKSNTK